MLISVVIPVYNVEKYLKDCLESVINQSYKKLEIICVNDGSTDSSCRILEEYASKDERIKIINQKNGGLSSARNTGIKFATGDWISFIDSDDWIELNTYELLRPYCSDTISSIWFGTNVIYESNEELKKSDDEYFKIKKKGRIEINDEILFTHPVTAWNKLYNLKFIREYELRFPEGRYFEDNAFFWCMFSVTKDVFCLEDKLYNYRRRQNSIMHMTYQRRENVAISYIYLLDDIIDFWKKFEVYLGREEVFSRLCNNFFWHAYHESPQYERSRVVWELAKRLRRWNIVPAQDNLLTNIKDGNYDINFYPLPPKKFIHKKQEWYKKIFVVHREGNHKVCRIFGIKIFSKSKKR